MSVAWGGNEGPRWPDLSRDKKAMVLAQERLGPLTADATHNHKVYALAQRIKDSLPYERTH